LKKIFHWLFLSVKWLIAVIIMVEVASFLAVCISNYWIYGQLRDGDPVRYDPYALFLEGVRPTHYNPAPGQSRVTVWLFGGSTMRGACDHDSRTIPSYLAKLWNRQEPTHTATMVNCGQDGFNSLMETKYLQKRLIENPPPNLIVFYDGGNDCAYFAQDRTPDAHQGYERVRGMIEDYHRSFFGLLKPLNAAMWSSFTREIYDKMREGVFPINPKDPEVGKFVDRCEEQYDFVNKVSAAFGAQFLLIWQPCWWAETAPVAPAVQAREHLIMSKKSALRHNFVVTYNALEERLKNKPYFVDFRNIVCSRTQPVYQRDGLHMLAVGRKIMAQDFDRVLKQRLLAQKAPGKKLAEIKP
jgi:hypothetical protein